MLNTLVNHKKQIDQLKEDSYEVIGYARKSHGKEELKSRYNSLKRMVQNLLNHSKCDQVFISPSSQCSTSLNDRDHDSKFVGNTEDMLSYITTSEHNLCLVILDYAGLCSRGSLVKYFLQQHPAVKKVVVDLFHAENSFVVLESADIIEDASKFESCRVKYVNRSL